ncbi:hypothetical protein D3C76_1780720 [compost metagenome]
MAIAISHRRPLDDDARLERRGFHGANIGCGRAWMVHGFCTSLRPLASVCVVTRSRSRYVGTGPSLALNEST